MKILCPTDFSQHAYYALEYAVNLANTLDAELHIISVYQVQTTASSMISIEYKIRENNEQDMQALLSGIGPLIEGEKIPITQVSKGNAVDMILDYVTHHDIDLLVMGTQGNNSLRTKLFGSTTKKVAAKSSVPILAIPEKINPDFNPKKVLMALDEKVVKNEDAFKIPKLLAAALELEIDVLHVSSGEEDQLFDPFITSYLDEYINEVVVEEGIDPVVRIKTYVEENQIGMVMMIRRKKSFLQHLLFVRNTSEEIGLTNVPLMIIPE